MSIFTTFRSLLAVRPLPLAPLLLRFKYKLKTNHSVAKRFRKTAEGYKAGQIGRQHGNTGWLIRMLNQKRGVHHVNNKARHHSRIRKLIPYA